MYAANKRVLQYTVTDADNADAPLDMSSYASVKWAMSRIDSEGNILTSPVLEKSESGGGIVLSDGAGDKDVASVTILTADTTNLLTGSFYTELEVTDSAIPGESVVLATGTLTILKNVVNA